MPVDLKLSNSKAKTAQRCLKQYEFKYVRKLRPKRFKAPLFIGDWMHQLLMVHYDGHDWRERHRELKKQFSNLFEEEREDLGFDLPDQCARLMRSYLWHWKPIDDELRTVDSELDETIELPNGIKFQFIIDRVM